jgi:uncharacterized protein (DUF2132 family)
MIYGWDISTSIVGLSCFTNDGVYENSFHLDLRKTEGQLAKADAFHEWLTKGFLLQRGMSNYHMVEERLGGFSGGRTSQQVILKLAQFNAIASYIIWNHDPGPHRAVLYLHPSTWKASMKAEGLLIPKGTDSETKKKITLAYVQSRAPRFPTELNRNDKPQPWCYDMADAYCIGRAGWRKLQSNTSSD